MFGQVLGRDKGFLVMIEFLWFNVAIGVHYVATWFLGLRQFLGRDIVFPCRNCILLLCRNNVMTKGFLIATETVTIRGQVL